MREHEGPGAPPLEPAQPISLGRTPGKPKRPVVWDPVGHGHLLIRGPEGSGKTTVARTILARALERGWGILLFDGAFGRHTFQLARLYGRLSGWWTTGRVVADGWSGASGLEGLLLEVMERERASGSNHGKPTGMPLVFVLEDPSGIPRAVDSYVREPGYARWCLLEIAERGPAVGVYMVVCARPWELRSPQNASLRATLQARVALVGAGEPGRGVYRAPGLPATELLARRSVPSTLDRIWRRVEKAEWAQESAEGVLW